MYMPELFKSYRKIEVDPRLDQQLIEEGSFRIKRKVVLELEKLKRGPSDFFSTEMSTVNEFMQTLR